MNAEAYAATESELERRIQAIADKNPRVYEIKNVYDLLKVEGFDCSDLQPSYAQAMFALAAVQLRHKGNSV